MSLLASKTREQVKALRARAEKFAVANDRTGYDAFWADDELVELYLEPGRIENFRQVARRCPNVSGCCIDLGCGVGTMLEMLATQDVNQRCSFYGIDYSEAAFSEWRRRVPF